MTPESHEHTVSRRKLLQAAGAGVASLTLAGAIPTYLVHASDHERAALSSLKSAEPPTWESYEVEHLGSVDEPLQQEQIRDFIMDQFADVNAGRQYEDNTCRLSYGVYRDPYQRLPESFGYESFDDFISYHAHRIAKGMWDVGLRNPFTGETVDLRMKRIAHLDQETGAGLGNLKDSYHTGNPDIRTDYDSPEDTAYEWINGEGYMEDEALKHEEMHYFFFLPDMNRQDMDGRNEPALAGINSRWQQFISNARYIRHGGGLMSGVGHVIEPYIAHVIGQRIADDKMELYLDDQYKDLRHYRIRVTALDSLQIHVLNAEALSEDVESVEVYRSENNNDEVRAVAEESVEEVLETMSIRNEPDRIQEARQSKKLVFQKSVPFNPTESAELAIHNPWQMLAEGDEPKRVIVDFHDSLAVLLFKNAAGDVRGVRYLSVTDITTGQPYDKALHKQKMSLGLHVADPSVDDPDLFNWDITYYDGTHMYLPGQQDVTLFPLMTPQPEVTPTPPATATPVPPEAPTIEPIEPTIEVQIPRRDLFLPRIWR